MIQRLKPKTEFSRNVLTLMTGTTIAQAIPIAITPILTRIYTPEDFGLFALYMAIASIVSVIATGRYELAILLPKKDEDAFQIAAFAGIITISVSFTLLIVVIIFNEDIAVLLNNNKIAPLLYFLPLSVLITGLYQTFNYWHNRNKRYSTIAKNRVFQSGGTTFSQLGFGTLQQSTGLIWGQIIGQLISLSYLVKIYFNKDKTLYVFKMLKVQALAGVHSKFPKIDVPTTLTNIAANQAPNILLSSLFSPGVAGFFYLTQRVLQAPITLISGSILDVFKQRASEDFKKHGHCREIFIKTFWALLLMALPSSVILFFWIEDLFAWMFGEPWREAGAYAQILIPALFLRFIANPLSFMFYVAEKQIYNLIGMIFLFLFIVIGLIFSSSSYSSIVLISTSYCLVYLPYIVLSARFAKVL